jgi:molybdenum cofactor cytidylyltransferase
LQQRTVSAVILAAGMSSRMGTTKQLLPFGNSTLLETVIDKMRRSGANEVIVVLGASADEIRRTIHLDGVRVVINEEFRDGMGASLRRGIAEVNTDAALVVLADQPFVEIDTINRLIAEYRTHKPQIAIPLYRGFRGNPVLLDRSVFPEIIQLSGDIGCRAIFGTHSENILKVQVEDIGVLLDIDTREDLDKLQSASTRSLEAADLSGREWDARPRLVIVGAEKTGKTLASLGHLMNFSVAVVDPFVRPEEAAGADRIVRELDFSQLPDGGEIFVVIASAGRFDEEAIEQAVSTGARYIALVSNRRRAQEVLGRVAAKGIDPQKPQAVRTKAGIDIRAEGPEEIALSIMAEIIAERHRTA